MITDYPEPWRPAQYLFPFRPTLNKRTQPGDEQVDQATGVVTRELITKSA